MADIVGSIVSIEDGSYQGKDFKKVTLGDGTSLKVKYGREGMLKAKWGDLQVGRAYTFVMGDYNGKQFVQDFRKVEDGLPPAKTPGVVKEYMTKTNEMSKDDWAEKDKITRKSIEDQTRAKIIAELVIADKANDTLAKKLNDYLSLLGDSTEPRREATESTRTASKPVSSATVFNNAGSLKTAMKETLKMTGLEIAAATAGYDLTTEKGRKDCWAATLELREGKPDETVATDKETGLDPEGLFE